VTFLSPSTTPPPLSPVHHCQIYARCYPSLPHRAVVALPTPPPNVDTRPSRARLASTRTTSHRHSPSVRPTIVGAPPPTTAHPLHPRARPSSAPSSTTAHAHVLLDGVASTPSPLISTSPSPHRLLPDSAASTPPPPPHRFLPDVIVDDPTRPARSISFSISLFSQSNPWRWLCLCKVVIYSYGMHVAGIPCSME
jgi:hypothetical protein